MVSRRAVRTSPTAVPTNNNTFRPHLGQQAGDEVAPFSGHHGPAGREVQLPLDNVVKGGVAPRRPAAHRLWHTRLGVVRRMQWNALPQKAPALRQPSSLPAARPPPININALEGRGAVHQLVQQDAKGPPVHHAVVSCVWQQGRKPGSFVGERPCSGDWMGIKRPAAEDSGTSHTLYTTPRLT